MSVCAEKAIARPPAARDCALHVALRLTDDGPTVATETVAPADLADARAELWLRRCLRGGRPGVPLDQIKAAVEPIFSKAHPDQLDGYALVAVDGLAGVKGELVFTIDSLDRVASRASQRLLAAGILKQNDTYLYDVRTGPAPSPATAAAPPPTASHGTFTVTVKSQPLAYICLPIKPLLAHAVLVGKADDSAYPLFYTKEALADAERFARRGASSQPPTETGAVLVGVLGSCPDTGEFYGVVCTAIEVLDAEQTKYSLYYSDRSWARIQAMVRAMQSQPATRAFRVLGQAHGHPFPPHEGNPPCETCPDLAKCTKTSVFVSTQDLNWSRAVFARQPFALCHIFGRDARGNHVNGLFGQRNCTLRRRPYYVLPEFDPAAILKP